MGEVVELLEGPGYGRPFLIAHQAGDRLGKRGEDGAILDDDHPPTDAPEMLDRQGHVAIIGTTDDEVVAVVADGGSHRPRLHPQSAEEGHPDIAGALVPLDNGNLDDVLVLVVHPDTIGDRHMSRARIGGDTALDQGDDTHMVTGKREGKALGGEVPDINSRCYALITAHHTALYHLPILGDKGSSHIDLVHGKVDQVIGKDEIRPEAGGYGPTVLEVIAVAAVDRRHADRLDGVEVSPYGEAHVVIDVPLLEDRFGLAIIGAEAAPPDIGRGDPAKQRQHIMARRAFAQEDVHPPPDTLMHLLDALTFVFSEDADASVGIKRPVDDLRAVPVDDLARSPCRQDLLQHLIISCDDTGVVHHLTEAEDAGMGKRFGDILRPDLRTTVLKRCGWYTGGHHEESLQRRPLGGIEHVGEAVKAGDIAQLMGVADRRGRTTGDDEVAELLWCCMARFYMDVAVDEARQQVAAASVDDSIRLPLSRFSKGCDGAIGDEQVGFKELLVVHIQNLRSGDAHISARPPTCDIQDVLHMRFRVHDPPPCQSVYASEVHSSRKNMLQTITIPINFPKHFYLSFNIVPIF